MDNAAPDKSGFRLPPSALDGLSLPCAEPSLAATAAPGADANEELDVWYGAYSGRAMVPRLIQLTLLSVLILVTAWYLGAWNGASAVRLGAIGVLCLLWLVQSILWVRRAVGYNYRLTTRRLYCQQGFGHPGAPGIDLLSITQVQVEASRAERWLNVGRVRVYRDKTTPPVILDGIRYPFHVAKQIRRRLGAS
jgi:hypothetical protein